MRKKIIKAIIIVLGILLLASSCGKKNKGQAEVETTKKDIFDFDENYAKKKVGVIYFSVTGNTKGVADKIAEIFDTEAIAIEPVKPYTDEDLNYNDKNSRSYRENEFDVFHQDEGNDDYNYTPTTDTRTPREIFDKIIAKEKELYGDGYETISKEDEESIKNEVFAETSKTPEEDVNERLENKKKVDEANGKVTELPKINKINVKNYNVIFLGYPIWFGQAPKVMYTFIDNEDLNGKVIVPFCTSASSDMADSDQNLANYAPDKVNFMTGKRFDKNVSIEELKEWITKIGVDIDFN